MDETDFGHGTESCAKDSFDDIASWPKRPLQADADGRATQFDPVSLYMRRVGAVPLLSREREVEIAKRIEEAELAILDLVQTADPAIAALRMPDDGMAHPRIDLLRLHRDRVREAIDRLRARGEPSGRHAAKGAGATTLERISAAERRAKRARAEMIEANLRLVIAIAKRHANRGLPFLDLIQEGNIGLMKAVEKFEYRRGYKFSTYATWWIRQAITRAVTDQSRTIRVPVHMAENLSCMARTVRELAQELGRDPTIEEIGQRMGIAPERVRWIRQATRPAISLDTPVGDGDESLLGDFVEDGAATNPPDRVIATDLARRTRLLLCMLPVREEKVLRMRFGIGESSEHTLEEVGQSFRLTRERIRQIEARALSRLRLAPRVGDLKASLD